MADIQTLLNQFINGVWLKNAKGKDVWVAIGLSNDYDGYYLAQCMDWVLYWEQFLGLPLLQASSALNTWNLSPDPAHYQRVTGIPQPGDITVWGSVMGPFGHTDIVMDNIGPVGFRGTDQNWFNSNETVGSPAAYVNHTYIGVLGWYRPVIAPTPALIQVADETQQQMLVMV